MDLLRPVVKVYHRSRVLELQRIPPGRCLLVSNHSGGLTTPDFAVFAVDFYQRFGYDRPLYVLAHDSFFGGPAAEFLFHLGVVPANPHNAAVALQSDAAVLLFPGGDLDVYRPSLSENVIDFGGRTGYVEAAVAARAPIVPVVSIGGQETQLYLSRGRRLSRALGLTGLERRLFRTDILPVSFGLPFGLSVLVPVNMPLPSKIVAEVLEPINAAAMWEIDPDVARIDGRVRRAMQAALDRLARHRRLPIIG
ncbi:MAG TPA: 1-acyl-sn-glycerol-3-phosphate acyltransferase [Mycobacterium sp.]|nr:1-acyl-sn-glycerol-3-phosphate acyltransferase [Mycobacterium sp.]HQE13975.1 1-acyl-sn-glycerol-3-phosphate acyltransferase [Mycobacterium sp.]